MADRVNTIAALVPMRHHSERVPGKNYRMFAGKPLYAHIIETLLACPQIDQIAVDTDSPIILEGLVKKYPGVIRIERPEALRGGMVSMNDILTYDTQKVAADFYLQTHSTNPLLRSETIQEAVAAYQEFYPDFDALFSVTRFQTRLWDALEQPVNHNPEELIRTQDLKPLYVENSCIYLFEREAFRKTGNRYCLRPKMFEIDAIEAIDIDEEVDFQMAECMALARP
ncbi:MAG: acylneuraminate cytidylyltransferase family protein [Anaerolineales bacterium]|nr:acylneuraminate cytidylyltransferase family protein [Anaerolineales bacterium]